MRNLFLALVLANLAFAAWHAWFAAPPPASRPAPRAAPGITLVSELPADAVEQVAARTVPPAATAALPAIPSSAAAVPPRDESVLAVAPAPPPTPDSAAQSARCVSVGPFRELSQAASAAASLRMAGYMPTQRVGEGDVWIGYWVYIQAIPTETEANAILERVRAQGVSDSYVIPNSDSGNLVSLGVFTEIGGVTRRREEMRALGFEPTVVDRTRRATVYWVDVLLAPDQTLDLETLQTPGRILRLEQRACEPQAA
jgi:hypothetical protein